MKKSPVLFKRDFLFVSGLYLCLVNIKKQLAIIAFLLITSLIPQKVLSQCYPGVICRDSSRLAQPTYSCPFDYYPVCGCDGKTYRNQCVAEFQNGLQCSSYPPCNPFDLYIAPNQVTSTLTLNFYAKTSGFITVYLYSVMGYIEYTSVINAAEGVTTGYYVDLTTIRTGLYILEAIKDGNRSVMKIVVQNPE
jgi:hypothetical protein